jgi:hypothetical protein
MTRMSRAINVPRVTKKSRLAEFVKARGWSVVGEAEWAELRTALPDVSESTIRSAALVGFSIAAPWKGVAQHTLEELETSLRELTEIYEVRPDLRPYCRRVVIEAKDRAKWLSRSGRIAEDKRQVKAEMAEWMLVWLGDPAVFPSWVALRRAKIESCFAT